MSLSLSLSVSSTCSPSTVLSAPYIDFPRFFPTLSPKFSVISTCPPINSHPRRHFSHHVEHRHGTNLVRSISCCGPIKNLNLMRHLMSRQNHAQMDKFRAFSSSDGREEYALRDGNEIESETEDEEEGLEDERRVVDRWDVLGLGQAMVDFSGMVDDKFLERLGLQKGTRKVVNHEERGKVLGAMDGCSYKAAAGGSLSNSLVALARLGSQPIGGPILNVAMAGSVGSDPLGGFYRAKLRRAGVNFLSAPVKDGTTGTVIVLTTPDAQRTMLAYQAVPQINSSGDCYDNWATGVHDQAIWATEDEHKNWNTGPSSETLSNSNYSSGLPAQSGIEQPNNKSRTSQSGESSNSRSKALGRMFFKTKLCCKFRAGFGRHITNCNFSHGKEELRRPPPIWQDVVVVNEEERGICDEQREEHQIPTINSSDLDRESQRSYKGRHCKKFFTDKGCPYADSCTFLHDEQSRARESVTISVNITVSDENGIIGAIQKPLNWKTRICNKWETTGNCPFGSKCHFAHGLAELHRYSGELLEVEGRDFSAPMESKQSGVTAKTDTVTTSALSAPCADLNHVGLATPSQRLSSMTHPPKQRHLHKWKGPEKISRIYGDWIDDIE